MTNSEMCIDALKLCKKTRMFIPSNDILEIAISALEENDKLKAEIEQLKSELEQSIKLPCKVGDVVYRVNGKIIPMTIESVLIKNRNGNILMRIDCIENEFKGEFSYISDNIQNDIGKRVFLTREEAEQHLKGKVEEWVI